MATYYVRTDGNDANTGLGPATNQAWQTITKAIGATGIAPGDTLYIAPGVYRGSFEAAFTNPTQESQRISIIGNPTSSQFSGVVPGPVILTNFLNSTSTSGVETIKVLKSFITYRNLVINGYTAGSTPLYGRVFRSEGSNIIIDKCSFYTPQNNVDINVVVHLIALQSLQGYTVTNCTFMAPVNVTGVSTTSAWDQQTSFTNCLFINPSTYIPTSCLMFYSPSGHIGGITVQNCRFIGNTGISQYPNSYLSTTYPMIVRNCIFETSLGLSTTGTVGQILESYNIFNCGTARTNVSSGTGSISRAFISPDMSMSRITGWGNYPFFSNHDQSYSQSAGLLTGAPASDMFGISWLAPTTPTIGPVEYSNNQALGNYLPTERNSSTITLTPGSTSQSIELYLGTTGLTYQTSGLQAYYARNRSAPVQITLANQTATGSWISGGFAEISSGTMPGLYRLDVPDAAFASGSSDVTITVRGASGTNGAILTVNLSPVNINLTQSVPTSNTAQTVGDALNAARAYGFGKWVISGTTLSLYASDNTTVIKTFTLDSGSYPTSRT